MNDELDRLIKELDILRINIASMAARVESIQSSLEQLKERSNAMPVEPEAELQEEPEPQPVAEIMAEPTVEADGPEADEEAADAEAIAESAEMEEAEDANEPQESDEPQAADEPDPVGEPLAEVEEEPEPVVEHPSSPGRELRQFLTINDRYRFRRELFGNSDTGMADTLNMIEAMASVAEVQEYVYSDLEWDPDVDEVQEFMDIVVRYFNER